eukprot:685275-Pleurochrysis_carterae.AAC.3
MHYNKRKKPSETTVVDTGTHAATNMSTATDGSSFVLVAARARVVANLIVCAARPELHISRLLTLAILPDLVLISGSA